MVKTTGTFCHTVCQKDVDFMVACGHCADEAKKMLGKTVKMTMCEAGAGKVACHFQCDEMPSMNSFHVFCEGMKTKCCAPMLGGKCEVKMCKNKAGDGYECEVCSEKYGKCHIAVKCMDDCLIRTICKDGKMHEQKWDRMICENGFYRCVKTENTMEFMKKAGMPEEICARVDDYTLCWKACESGVKMTECWGDLKACCSAHFDKECDYQLPIEGCPPCKMLVTKCGNGMYKCFTKEANGTCCEWTFKFCDDSAEICGKNMKTGDCCKMCLVKCCPMAGTYKPICITGVHEPMKALGVPSELCHKMANDFDARLVIEDCCPVYRWCMKSKVCPMEMCFKMDEEFEVCDPVMNEKCKCVCTQSGNCLISVCKYANFTCKTKCTFTENFVVMKSCIEGMNCPPMTYVWERC